MQIVRELILIKELEQMSHKMFEKLVKVVVDVEREIMVVDADLHVDEESLLLEDGSEQENLWGINIYPDKFGNAGWVVFDSMINIRPNQGNRSRGVNDPNIQKKIMAIVERLVKQ